MPVKLRRELLDMLGGLKQTIIWKLEEDMPDNKYKNVHVVSYAPQQSILGEKNPTAFIKKNLSLSYLLDSSQQMSFFESEVFYLHPELL